MRICMGYVLKEVAARGNELEFKRWTSITLFARLQHYGYSNDDLCNGQITTVFIVFVLSASVILPLMTIDGAILLSGKCSPSQFLPCLWGFSIPGLIFKLCLGCYYLFSKQLRLCKIVVQKCVVCSQVCVFCNVCL